jgi:glycosyltransferase involved in cell wall biosynthesis
VRVLAWPAFATAALNPYQARLYAGLEALGASVSEFEAHRDAPGGFDVLHVHWPEAALNTPEPDVAARRARETLDAVRAHAEAGARVVWTAHNLASHERFHPALERAFWEEFAGLVSGVIALSRAGLELVRAERPRLAAVPGFDVPHPHYRDEFPDPPSREAARAALGLAPGARVVAFAGQVRRYKNVPGLVGAFRGLEDPGAVLVVAGKPVPPELEAEVRAAAGDDPRVRPRLEFLSGADLEAVVRAADLVALPFRDVLNSGSALLALSLERPVLAAARGALPELQAEAGPDWVRLLDGPPDAPGLGSALAWALETPRDARPSLVGRDWGSVARRTLEAFEAVLRAG